jgi:hypothetical protein
VTKDRPETLDYRAAWVSLVLKGYLDLTARRAQQDLQVPLGTRVQWVTKDLRETLAQPDSRERLALRARRETRDL